MCSASPRCSRRARHLAEHCVAPFEQVTGKEGLSAGAGRAGACFAPLRMMG
ncbi:MAG: hypothetical protein AB1556_09690 [Bacillota bacterium]